MARDDVFIYHIANRQAWERAQLLGSYQSDTLATEGFIHCSTREQVIRTAERYYQGLADLVLLCIDSGRVAAEIRYEASIDGEVFPHIYGPLDITAVRQIATLDPEQDNSFSMPSAFDIP